MGSFLRLLHRANQKTSGPNLERALIANKVSSARVFPFVHPTWSSMSLLTKRFEPWMYAGFPPLIIDRHSKQQKGLSVSIRFETLISSFACTG